MQHINSLLNISDAILPKFTKYELTKENIKNDKIDTKNKLIVQHNNLIEAHYHLTLQEKRLLCWLISQIKPTDDDFKEHIISVKEFADLIEVKGDHLYKVLDDVTTKLMRRIIIVRGTDSKDFKKVSLLCGAEYQSSKGIVKLNFHPHLKPYILQIKEKFTQIKLADILSLRSIYSIRVYELIKQYENFKKRTIILSDLRNFCGISSEQYKFYNDFKKNILERAKKEINAKTDITVEYIEIKESRKIIAIEWTIQKKDVEKQERLEKIERLEKELRSQGIIVDSLLEHGFSRTTIKRFITLHGEKTVKDAIRAVDLQVERGKAKNPKAMIRTAIEEKWHPEVFKKKF